MKDQNWQECIENIQKLRNPIGGCPWDLEQTHESLIPYLLEESYEFIDTVKRKSYPEMKDELGDILLQVLLHSQLASENGAFEIDDVVLNLNKKIRRRHPHVFEKNQSPIDKETVEKNWTIIKSKEKKKDPSIIPDKLLLNPSLVASTKIGEASKKINFDWENRDQVMYKVEEEWQELKEVLYQRKDININLVEEEMGDLLFSIAQLARHCGLNPEETLDKANKKFMSRFREMEKICRESNTSIDKKNSAEMENLWVQAKEKLKK